MPKEMIINPHLCIGCSTCALTCSFTHHGQFDLNKSYVSVTRHDFEGVFFISFSSLCKGCRQCAESCPSGALRTVELPDPATDTGEK